MKITLLLLSVILISLQNALSQGYPMSGKSLITSFLKEVYETKDDSRKIALDYILLGSEASELSVEKRYEIASQHISMLRLGESLSKDNKITLSKENFIYVTIENFSSLNEKILPAFSLSDSQKDNVYVVLYKGLPFKYFFVDKNKILSFDYIKKGQGGPAYFFSY